MACESAKRVKRRKKKKRKRVGFTFVGFFVVVVCVVFEEISFRSEA